MQTVVFVYLLYLREMANNSREVDELARDIVRHPHFRSALSESVARRREQPHAGEHQQPQPTHDAPSQGRGDRRLLLKSCLVYSIEVEEETAV